MHGEYTQDFTLSDGLLSSSASHLMDDAGLRLQVWGNKPKDIILRLHSNISVSSWTIINAHKFVEGIQDNGGTKAIVNTIPHLIEHNSPMSIDRQSFI